MTTFEIQFDCQWCSEVNRCSDGYDRHRQHWLNNDCTSKVLTADRQCVSPCMTNNKTRDLSTQKI